MPSYELGLLTGYYLGRQDTPESRALMEDMLRAASEATEAADVAS